MSDVRARLNSLVELATENAPEKRRALAIELCDMLLMWPTNYPAAMRDPFEVLLEKTVRMIDRDTRNALIARIANTPGVRREFVNEFFFDATPEMRLSILDRNVDCAKNDNASAVDEAELVAAARVGDGFNDIFATLFGVSSETASRIVGDTSAQSLALAIKGAHLSRATFSTLVMLVCPGKPSEIETRLAAFDSVEDQNAASILAYWRERASHIHARAA